MIILYTNSEFRLEFRKVENPCTKGSFPPKKNLSNERFKQSTPAYSFPDTAAFTLLKFFIPTGYPNKKMVLENNPAVSEKRYRSQYHWPSCDQCPHVPQHAIKV